MSRNVCARSADVLVHGLRPVPEDPEDFLWGDLSPAIGCNALACSRCGAALRQGAGWRLADGLGAEAMAALHGLDDWETHGGLLVPEPVARTWVCRCHGLTVTFPRALRGGGAADEHPAPIGWHCASHPLRTFPVALDGVTLEGPERITPDWVAAMLRRSPPDLGSPSGLVGPAPRGPSAAQPDCRRAPHPVCPDWLGPAPAAWLVRLWFELADRAAADRLAEHVARSLTPEAPELASALHFFAGIPSGVAAAFSDRVADLTSVADARAPWPPHEPVARLLRRLARRLSGGAPPE